MVRLTFTEPEQYTPDMSTVPEAWKGARLEEIDFTDAPKRYAMLEWYFEEFKVADADSLAFFGTTRAYTLMVGLYRELAARMTVDKYGFMQWQEFLLKTDGPYQQSIKKMFKWLEDKRFCFIFDVAMASDKAREYFTTLLKQCYINRIRLYVCTSEDYHTFRGKLQPEARDLFDSKIFSVKI